MSFVEDLIRVIRAPFDALRNWIWGVRSIEGRVQGDMSRLRSLPNEFRGEVNSNVQAVKSYRDRAGHLKANAKMRAQQMRTGGVLGQLRGGAPQPAGVPSPPASPSPSPTSARARGAGGALTMGGRKPKMGLFSKKKKCPNCREKLHVSWDLCPYCGFGAPAAAPMGPGGHPRTQALDVQGFGVKGRTMALDAPAGDARPRGGGVGWLVPLEGPQSGQLFQLANRSIIGTAPECEVVVDDPSVSARHAEFTAQGNMFRISDLGSTNGTFVNDKRVTSSDLVDNDTLRLGRTNFKFKSIT
jgi:hypothetical protein